MGRQGFTAGQQQGVGPGFQGHIAKMAQAACHIGFAGNDASPGKQLPVLAAVIVMEIHESPAFGQTGHALPDGLPD